MTDQTETTRRQMVQEINSNSGSREYLEQQHGQVWDTSELQQEFSVLGFMAPFIIVQRKSDHVKGSLFFQHDPRLYYGFKKD